MAHLSPPNSSPTVDIDDNLGEYSAVSGLAVTGLILGCLSIMALIHPLLWVLPLAAVVANGLALRRIAAAAPQLIGRKAALLGLALALIFAISAPVQFMMHNRELRRQSVEIAREWFTALRENRPELAHRLTQFPTTAMARASSPLEEYKGGSMPHEALQKFVHGSPVELLLKLGKRGHVRYYENEDVWADHYSEGVRDIYAVTVGDGPRAVSFFIRLGTTRTRDLATGDWQWQVSRHEFMPVPPPGWIAAVEDTL